MKAIRYSLHFPALIVAVLVFWLAKDLNLHVQISGFDFFDFGLIGALHATSIVVSLRERKAAFPVIALCFITLAAVWSAVTPVLELWSNFLWAPLLDKVPHSDMKFILPLFFLIGSAIGCAGYWPLVRLFWLKSLRLADWLRTMALCVAATLLSVVAVEVLNPRVDIFLPLLTAAWWFAFSTSLYWSEVTGYANKSTAPMETVP